MIFARWRQCAPQPNACFLGTTRVQIPNGISIDSAVFGQPFVKRFALRYRTVVCLSCLSVTLVYCGQTVGWIKMKLGTKVRLGPSHIVLDGDPATHKWAQPAPQFSAHVCCGQTAGWIKMPLCTKVVLGPTTLCQTQLSPAKKGGTAPAPSFRPMSILAKRSSISATAEHLSTFCVAFQFHIFITG